MRFTVYGLGGFDPSKPNNNIIEDYEAPNPKRLRGPEIIATLNAVLGVWSLEDAANAVNLAPADLIAEAQAWAVAAK